MQILTANERKQVIALATEAGTKLLEFWRSDSSTGDHLEITAKSDGSNVTNADIASNEIIVTTLSRMFPNDGILSEETPPVAELDNIKRVWIIDPLDGTQSFIEGRDDFSVLIALTINHRAVFGICYMPALNQMCISEHGGTTTLNGKKLKCSAVDNPRAGCVYIRGCSIADPGKKFPHHIDSCLAFTRIASGELDGAIIKLKRLKQWDLAATAALIIGAGGKVTDESGSEILYTAHNFNTNYFVASNGRCHEKLLQQIIE